MTEPRYPIRAASQLTGLSSDSIRSWERRYGAIKPERGTGGRLYKEEDIRRLKLLKRAIDHGHSIGQIARLSDMALEHLPIGREEILPKTQPGNDHQLEKNIDQILAFVEEYDQLNADRILGRLGTLLEPRVFVLDVIVPLMKRVGDAWKKGSLSIAQEHMVSAALRNILGTLIRLHTKSETSRKIIFTTTAEEVHEFGVLAAAMLAAAGGLGAVYLGPNLPVEEIVKASKKVQAHAVVLGYVQRRGLDDHRMANLSRLREGLPDYTRLVVGGDLSQKLTSFCNRFDIMTMKDHSEFEKYLSRLGAHF